MDDGQQYLQLRNFDDLDEIMWLLSDNLVRKIKSILGLSYDDTGQLGFQTKNIYTH